MERVGVAGDAFTGEAEDGGGLANFAEEEFGLFEGIGDDDDLRAGVEDGGMEGFDGDDGGFAPLAGTAEDEAVGFVIEDGFLDGVGLEVEKFLGPLGDDWDCWFWTHLGIAMIGGFDEAVEKCVGHGG